MGSPRQAGNSPANPAGENTSAAAGTNSIATLVHQSRSGNREAFTHLYEQFNRVVYTMILSKVSSKEDALDLTQETFMVAFERLHTLKEEEKFGSWLYGIASHLAINHVQRSDRGKKPLLPEEIAEPASPETPSPQEMAKSVWDAIHALPERYHLPLLLRYMEGMSPKEIADKTDLSYGSTRVILCEGTKMLREKLKPMVSKT